MIIFGIYTHASDVHLCLKKDEDILKIEKYGIPERQMSKDLPEYVRAFLKDIIPDCIALHNGPSSFTTLRVTLAYLQGLAIGYHAKIFAISHFQLIQSVFNIQNGSIAINHNGATYPGVWIKDGQIGSVEAFDQPSSYDMQSKNMAVELVQLVNNEQLISAYDLTPEYGLLPEYKKVGI